VPQFFGCVGWFFVRDGLREVGRYALVWPVLVYAMGSMLLGLHEQFAWRSLDAVLPFVFMIFGVWLLRRYKPCDAWLWCGIAIGALGAACFAAYQVLTVGGRAGGYLHPIQFGNIALLLGVLCMVRALVHTRVVWLNVLMWVGFLLVYWLLLGVRLGEGGSPSCWFFVGIYACNPVVDMVEKAHHYGGDGWLPCSA